MNCNSFGLQVSLGQSGLVYFALAFLSAPFGFLIRSCYFNQAISIARLPSKVPNGSQPETGLLPAQKRIVK
jgi:hypothetical protein